MIYVNDKKLIGFNKNKMSIVTDFDKTLTSAESESTLGIFSKFLPDSYVKAKNDINKEEESISINNDLTFQRKKILLKYIWVKKLILLSKYLKDINTVKEIVDSGLFNFRDGAIESLNYLQKKYEVIINSSGMGNLIVELLKSKGCSFDNLKVFSNFYDFNTSSFDLQNCIFSADKVNKEYLEAISNKQLILLGDTLEDLSMVPKNKTNVSIAFLDGEYHKYLNVFRKSFDIVATENESYDAPIKRLKL